VSRLRGKVHSGTNTQKQKNPTNAQSKKHKNKQKTRPGTGGGAESCSSINGRVATLVRQWGRRVKGTGHERERGRSNTCRQMGKGRSSFYGELDGSTDRSGFKLTYGIKINAYRLNLARRGPRGLGHSRSGRLSLGCLPVCAKGSFHKFFAGQGREPKGGDIHGSSLPIHQLGLSKVIALFRSKSKFKERYHRAVD